MQLRHCSFLLLAFAVPSIPTASHHTIPFLPSFFPSFLPTYLPTQAVAALSLGQVLCSVGICVVTSPFLPPSYRTRTRKASLPSLHPTFGIRPSLSSQPIEFLSHLAAGPDLSENVGQEQKTESSVCFLSCPKHRQANWCPPFLFFPTVTRHPANQKCGFVNLHYLPALPNLGKVDSVRGTYLEYLPRVLPTNTYPPELD
ncbi:hypothetical protein LY76DRAFT_382347 [Colletotrichum caudatum]|nr:hypothetical protein LY76DRAFT_382347 [Colletotrichum caudatum]